MKQKTKYHRYYIETIGEDVNLFAIPEEERIYFGKEHPTAEMIDRKIYEELIKRLHHHEQRQKDTLVYNK